MKAGGWQGITLATAPAISHLSYPEMIIPVIFRMDVDRVRKLRTKLHSKRMLSITTRMSRKKLGHFKTRGKHAAIWITERGLVLCGATNSVPLQACGVRPRRPPPLGNFSPIRSRAARKASRVRASSFKEGRAAFHSDRSVRPASSRATADSTSAGYDASARSISAAPVCREGGPLNRDRESGLAPEDPTLPFILAPDFVVG